MGGATAGAAENGGTSPASGTRARLSVSLMAHVPLVPQAREISQSHYADVVEERTIERLCGYPLCGCGLGHVTKQRYHISVQRREVLDLTERKVQLWGGVEGRG